jgi:hypothetical protein
MLRTLLTTLAGGALVAAACTCALGSTDNLELRARVSIGRLVAGDGPGQPVESESGFETKPKSVARAMLLSALLPGMGQIYADGTRGYVTGAAFATVDVFSIWQYFSNNGKGDDRKGDYERWAKQYYSRTKFNDYVEDTIAVFSGAEEFSFCQPGPTKDPEECQRQIEEVFPLSKESGATYYEQIGTDDRYIFGWKDWAGGPNHEELWIDWDPYSPLPEGIRNIGSAKRDEYRRMRQEADDFFSKADRYAWIMVIGRVVSMIDAAILVKLRSKDLVGLGGNPRLTFNASLSGDPRLRVGVKVRF